MGLGLGLGFGLGSRSQTPAPLGPPPAASSGTGVGASGLRSQTQTPAPPMLVPPKPRRLSVSGAAEPTDGVLLEMQSADVRVDVGAGARAAFALTRGRRNGVRRRGVCKCGVAVWRLTLSMP